MGMGVAIAKCGRIQLGFTSFQFRNTERTQKTEGSERERSVT